MESLHQYLVQNRISCIEGFSDAMTDDEYSCMLLRLLPLLSADQRDIQKTITAVEMVGTIVAQKSTYLSTSLEYEVYVAWLSCTERSRSPAVLSAWVTAAAKCDFLRHPAVLDRFLERGIGNKDERLKSFSLKLMTGMSGRQLRAFTKPRLSRVVKKSTVEIFWSIYANCCQSQQFDWILTWLYRRATHIPRGLDNDTIDSLWIYIESIGYSPEAIWLIKEFVMHLRLPLPPSVGMTIAKMPLVDPLQVRLFGPGSGHDFMLVHKALTSVNRCPTMENLGGLKMLLARFGHEEVARHPLFDVCISNLRRDISDHRPIKLHRMILHIIGETLMLGDIVTAELLGNILDGTHAVTTSIGKIVASIWLNMLSRSSLMMHFTTAQIMESLSDSIFRPLTLKALEKADRRMCPLVWEKLERLVFFKLEHNVLDRLHISSMKRLQAIQLAKVSKRRQS